MPVPTCTRSESGAARGVGARLPWWALVLPAIAFAALLTLLAGSTGARAAGGEGRLGDVVQQIHQVLILTTP
ncbi:hypothetical protein [Streptomyces sp. GC420]|uniref:hypothetical protein n=1 Tax=Streptomyces sp. GC420 TaxID=2697568 RepID=UPI001414DA51|nr:hypothetical protein [Streptomyces sp. GC420]NBM14767.1 hypothetical protein [Streptomyces sp. GC420]